MPFFITLYGCYAALHILLDIVAPFSFFQLSASENFLPIEHNGCQPTSTSFIREYSLLGTKQAFTGYNNPKGNADTERAIRTAKEELLWFQDWRGFDHLKQELSHWVDDFNNNYLNLALGLKHQI